MRNFRRNVLRNGFIKIKMIEMKEINEDGKMDIKKRRTKEYQKNRDQGGYIHHCSSQWTDQSVSDGASGKDAVRPEKQRI